METVPRPVALKLAAPLTESATDVLPMPMTVVVEVCPAAAATLPDALAYAAPDIPARPSSMADARRIFFMLNSTIVLTSCHQRSTPIVHLWFGKYRKILAKCLL